MKKIFTFLFFFSFSAFSLAQSFDVAGPAGSERFGSFQLLANGNYLVTDPEFDDGPTPNVGAVYLYNGSTHQVISTLKGSHPDDKIGSDGFVSVGVNNVVVLSGSWNENRGAVTWINGTTGLSGTVSDANSLVGSFPHEYYRAFFQVTALSNGHYLVRLSAWNENRGAITWGNGSSGVSGIISSSNSLVGTGTNDYVGQVVHQLNNGNYLVGTTSWNSNAGALTWGDGSSGVTGEVSSSNSLVGAEPNSYVGGVKLLPGGNYLSISTAWNGNRGAVTWGSEATGISGTVSAANSLVGSTASDRVGSTVELLANGNYVVLSPSWNQGRGAVTWGDATVGVQGSVSAANSVIGAAANDAVGYFETVQLTNSNYVVRTPQWNNARGAATWCSGATATTGIVGISNSLVGSSVNDRVASSVLALTNGNYVTSSYSWNGNRGAVTWGSGTTGISGTISIANSLVGTNPDDYIAAGLTALSNGNYAIAPMSWNGLRGAIVLCDGVVGRTGEITADNALVGTNSNERVGGTVTPLSNGNFVVTNNYWNNERGSATWVNGTTGITGYLSADNSLVGANALDWVGVYGIKELANGNYVILSRAWNGSRGAVTWASGSAAITGQLSAANSLVGQNTNDGIGAAVTILANGNYVVLSQGWSNGKGAVTLCNGETGMSGEVTSSNSLVGSSNFDYIGTGIVELENGNFLVQSSNWNQARGATTWVNGSVGLTGEISNLNSLVGGSAYDYAGYRVVKLPESNYLVCSPYWNNRRGAITWGNGNAGISGVVGDANSLVGTLANDNLGADTYGEPKIKMMSNGDYLVDSPQWNNYRGAVTWGYGSSGVTGQVSPCNSVVGNPSFTYSVGFEFNPVHNYLLVGRGGGGNRMTIFNQAFTSISNSLDFASASINGSGNVQMIAAGNCRLIATITPSGEQPVSGVLNAKSWVESSIPTHNKQLYVARHYEITPLNNASSATGRITLYFGQDDFDTFNDHPSATPSLPTGPSDATGIANLRIAKFAGASSDETGLPGTYTGSVESIDPDDSNIFWNATASRWEITFETTGFSGFFVHSFGSSLPVTLVSFKGKLVEQNAVLDWRTTNEYNADKFVIERSTDARKFEQIGTVSAKNLTSRNDYQYTDPSVKTHFAEKLYYRLKQVDIDGRFAYSGMVAISVEGAQPITIFPNPATDQMNIASSFLDSTPVILRVVDIAGREHNQKQWHVKKGPNRFTLDISKLKTGVYFLEIEKSGFREMRLFVKH